MPASVAQSDARISKWAGGDTCAREAAEAANAFQSR